MAAVSVVILLVCVIVAILLFTAPKSPPPIAAVESARSRLQALAAGLPPYRSYAARDGTAIAYLYYPGIQGKGAAVLLHGSSGVAGAMHGLARSLAAAGVTVYVPDLRGHGGSGSLGLVSYRGQYEDDLADLAGLVGREHPGERRLLVGHSSGGSLALRTAAGGTAEAFDAYLALAPFIAPGDPLSRPEQGRWTSVSVPRIVVLSILNGFGIDALDDLKVLAMAVPPDAEKGRPRAYSHALLASLNLPRDWHRAIARIRRPTSVLIGRQDELFVAPAYPAALGAANRGIGVGIVEGARHMSFLVDGAAIAAATAEARRLLDGAGSLRR